MLYYEHLTQDDLANEIWADIPFSNGRYMISNMGKVYSIKRVNERGVLVGGIILKPNLTTSGYLQVKLSMNGVYKKELLHRLVGAEFIPNPKNKPEINHLFGNRTDNRHYRLEWATRSEQTIHAFKVLNAPKPKGCKGMLGALNPGSKKVICINNNTVYDGIAEAARNIGISASSVSVVCRGLKKHRKGYVFRFV